MFINSTERIHQKRCENIFNSADFLFRIAILRTNVFYIQICASEERENCGKMYRFAHIIMIVFFSQRL